MPPTWIKLAVDGFGRPAGTVLSIDTTDQRLPQLLNSRLAAVVADPGGTPPAVPGDNPGGDMATDAEVTTAVAALVNSAPSTLDTLAEIATALQADESAAAALAVTVGQKYVKPAGGIPSSDLATGVIPDLTDKSPYRALSFAPPSQPLRVVSAMDSGWNHLDDGAAVHDTVIFDTGAGSLKITAPGNGGKSTAQLTFSAQDWTDQALSFRFRTDDWASIIDGYLLASTSGNNAQFFRAQLPPKLARVVNGEWSEITLTRGDFDFNSGTANWATVNGLTFQLYSAASTTPSLWIDQLARYTTPPRATISFAFDDGFATVPNVAKPALDKYGYRGSAYLMPTALGTTGYMTQAQVDALAASGWELGGHAVNDLTTLSFAAAEADVAATKKYLVDRGYKGSDVYAYPLGGQSAALRTMVAKYFSAARGTSTTGQTRSYVARRNMPTRQLGTPITLATAQGWVDRAVANNEWLIITGHSLRTPTVTAEDWTPADFAALVDYVATKNVQILPVAEALAQNDAAAEGAYLTAPNGTRYRLTVGNDGALTTTAL